MNSNERNIKRTEIAVENGYVHRPVSETPEWAATELTALADIQASQAALRLRGLQGSRVTNRGRDPS